MNLKVANVAYKNIAFLLLGYLLLALGIVGIVLPVMPTTIFFILALGCFTRSSPKLANWLLNHPRYGATLQQWQQHQVVPIKAKWFAALGMFAGFVILNYSAAPYWVACMVAATEIIVLAYLLSRPSNNLP